MGAGENEIKFDLVGIPLNGRARNARQMSRKAFVSVEKRRVNSLFTTYILERGSLKSEKGVLWQLFHGEEAKNARWPSATRLVTCEIRSTGCLTISGAKIGRASLGKECRSRW